MEQVKVILYDDLEHHGNGSLIEAAASHILELDGKRVKLDLTDDNFRALADDLAVFLDAGSPWTGPLPGKTSARRRSQPPKPERLMLNQAYRLWAAWQGRVQETLTATGYYYKVKLRQDVEEWLRQNGMTAAEFVARAEAGHYPARDSQPAS